MSKRLIELIESIPGPARRYCHLQLRAFNPNSTTNLYLSDFENIEKGKASNLKSNQSRLYNKLLDILFQYYEMNVNLQESETRLIQRAFVLNKLGNTKDASKMADKAVQFASQNHNYLKYLEAIDQRLMFAIDHQEADYLLKYISNDKLTKEKAMNDYLISSEYQLLWTIIKEKELHNPLYNREELYKNNVYKKLLDKDAEQGLTTETKIIYYKIHGLYFMREKKYKEAYEIMNKINKIYFENEWLSNKDPLEYATNIKRTSITLLYLSEFDKIKELLNEYESKLYDNKKNNKIPFEIEYTIVQIKLDLIVHSQKYDFSQEQFNSFDHFLFNNFETIPPESLMILMYNFFLINLHLKNYKKCKKILNVIFSIDETIRNDVREFAYTGELTVYFLEGNIDLLENKLRALETRYKNKESFYTYTGEIVPFFKSVLKNLHSREKIQLLLQEILEKIQKEAVGFHYNHIPLKEMKGY